MGSKSLGFEFFGPFRDNFRAAREAFSFAQRHFCIFLGWVGDGFCILRHLSSEIAFLIFAPRGRVHEVPYFIMLFSHFRDFDVARKPPKRYQRSVWAFLGDAEISKICSAPAQESDLGLLGIKTLILSEKNFDGKLIKANPFVEFCRSAKTRIFQKKNPLGKV